MQLIFRCPRTGQGFHSENWSIQGSLQIIQRNGHPTLEGSVLVDCPICNEVHSFDPNELSCPFSSEPPGTEE
jgi:hypothetical protein